VLASLLTCPEAGHSTVFIFCDGPRGEADRALVEQTRAVAREQRGFGSLQVVEREQNLGLANSIRLGVSDLCEQFGKVIVLEDDTIVSSHFLEFQNEALHRFADDERVMQISGYFYPLVIPGQSDAFFLVHGVCWGWGTWKRAWQHFRMSEFDILKIEKDYDYRRSLNLDGAYPYSRMLRMQRSGAIDSWGVVWYATVFRRQGLVLFPRQTMVRNIGQDGSGSNSKGIEHVDHLSDFAVKSFPPVEPDAAAWRALCGYVNVKFKPWYRRLAWWIDYR
jgi:hypothetical protein